MRKLSYWSVLALGALTVAPMLEARTCTGNGDVVGAFGWTASRSAVFTPLSIDPPSTTVIRSITPIGALAGNAATGAPFSAVGRVVMDGVGGIFASPNATAPVARVGTYTLAVDCTLSVVINDVFAPSQEFFFGPVQASAVFEGVAVLSGAQISLTQTSGIGGTFVTLQKMKQAGGCADDSLTGSFGFSATGLSYVVDESDKTLHTTPFVLSGRLAGDGAGKFATDALAEQSPMAARQFTGAYSVATDCTGSGTLVDHEGKSRKISFVVINSGNGPAGAGGVIFAFTGNIIGSGLAIQQ